MLSDSLVVADPLSGRKVFAFAGSAMDLGTNTQAYNQIFSLAGAQENDDQRVINLQRERERRLLQHESEKPELRAIRSDKELPDTAGQPTLLKNWYALAQSDISPRNFGRLQNAATQFEGTDGLTASQTLSSTVKLFLTFWAAAKQGNREPELYVAANGRLQAVWSHTNGWFLVIEFGGDDKVFWAMYQDADIVEGEKPSATIAELAETLKALPSKPLRWRC